MYIPTINLNAFRVSNVVNNAYLQLTYWNKLSFMRNLEKICISKSNFEGNWYMRPNIC